MSDEAQTEPDWKEHFLALAKRKKIAWAMEQLAKALGERSDSPPQVIVPRVQQAERYLLEYLSEECGITLTEKECELSGNFHTALRKFDDTHAGSIMYRLHADERGKIAWRMIIKHWNDGWGVIVRALHNMDGSSDDLIMSLAFQAWGKESHLGVRKLLADIAAE